MDGANNPSRHANATLIEVHTLAPCERKCWCEASARFT